MTANEIVEKEDLSAGMGRIVYSNGQLNIYEQRNYKVVKANEIIQRARNDLSVAQLKAFAFALSKIKPTDEPGGWYSFTIKDYCRVLGLQDDNGGNYNYVKKVFKSLRDTSFWLMDENGKETTIGYLDKVEISRGSGRVRIRFDETLQDYLFGLSANRLQYSLIYTLPMRSAYSFNLYELLKSYAFTGSHTFEMDDFKRHMNCKYENFKDLRVKVIEISVREINLYTDIEVNWEGIKEGKKVSRIKFYIKEKDVWGQACATENANKELDGQMTIEDYMLRGKK